MIDRIFYINLDRRPDRNTNVQKQLKNAGLLQIAEKVSAVDGSKLDMEMVKPFITKSGIDDAASTTKPVYIPLTYGAIGCAMSHRSIWIRIRDDPQIKTALILEDDIDINKNFIHKLNTYKKYIPINYDILFLGYHPASKKYFLKDKNVIFVRSKKVYGLFGYVVTKEGASKLLRMFPISEQVDTAMYKCINKYGINSYLLKPKFRLITSEPSEIAKKFGTDIQIREKMQSNPIEVEVGVEVGTDIQTKEGFHSFFMVLDVIFVCLVIVLIKTFIDAKSLEISN